MLLVQRFNMKIKQVNIQILQMMQKRPNFVLNYNPIRCNKMEAMSKYKNSESGLLFGILSGFLFGIVVSHIETERQKRIKQTLSEIQIKLGDGFQADKANIESDWNKVATDFRKSYEKVSDECS